MEFWTMLGCNERSMKGALTRLAMGIAIPLNVLIRGSAYGIPVTRKGRMERTKEWKRCIWQIGNVQVGYERERNGTLYPEGKPDIPCMLLYAMGG
jgi:hypothetical protein